ncbi:MAG: glycoside hydrolase family 127 protein [Clostridia bacterium]|nr:glycoside hydrolase family 127 protein [Clostridia bacterium]
MRPIFNKAPLTPNTLSPLPLGSIRPEGWLLEEIRMQAQGITADFAAACPELTESGEWKRAEDGDLTRSIYYLEGILQLGWALDDDAMKQRARAMVDWIISSQREDGWFGPADNDDYWPLMLALRALRAFFTAENDKRVLVLMDRFFKYEYKFLADHPMKEFAVARGGENMEIALWLYNITGQKYLIELCKKLRAQTIDWPNFFHTFSNAMPMSKSQKWDRLREALNEEKDEPLMGEKRPYFHSQYHQTQGVNLAMGLKAPGVINMFKSGFKEQGGFRFGYEKLMKHHGVANGMFTCDTHINGANPNQGTSLQAIVEMLNTMETLIGIGDFGADPADVMEKIAYNALPAAFNADMTKYQRLQQVNQIKISAEPRKWYSEGEDANLFTSARNDLDCAACHQAWPKFAASQWYATNDGGLAAVSYAPCTVRAVLDGVPARIRVSGGYPFMQSVELSVSVKQSAEFPIYLRIPFWARQSMIYLPDGEIMQVRAGESACIRRRWVSGDVVRLEMPAAPRISRWYHQSGAVEVGPLLMALRPEIKWSEDGMCATAGEGWNRALVRDEPMKLIQIEEDIGPFGHGESATGVMVKAAKIDWPMDGANCAAVPMAPRFAKTALDILELVPYGEAPLRICCFPLGAVKEDKQKEIM